MPVTETGLAAPTFLFAKLAVPVTPSVSPASRLSLYETLALVVPS